VLADVASGRSMPADERHVSVVFQSALLFPHLTVVENVAFGPRARGVDRRAARERAEVWLARVGLADLAGRRPDTLSGGQAQRAALARALATDPGALLLDEPLAALDVATRHDVRRVLRSHLHDLDVPVLLVTHDPVEAATLADRIVVLEAGRVTHDGDLGTITGHPRTPWAARLAGVNLWAGVAAGTRVDLEAGGALATADALAGPVWVAAPPTAVALYPDPPRGTPRNVWPVTVGGLEPLGDRVRVQLDGRPPVVAEVTAAGAASLGLASHGTLWATVKATELVVYPR
jgi:molybdate transport system ATP-binding protein